MSAGLGSPMPAPLGLQNGRLPGAPTGPSSAVHVPVGLSGCPNSFLITTLRPDRATELSASQQPHLAASPHTQALETPSCPKALHSGKQDLAYGFVCVCVCVNP